MVSLNQVEAGIARYIDAEIAPKIPVMGQYGQIKKVTFLTGAMYLVKHSRGLVEDFLNGSMSNSIGLSDREGNVDLEGVIEAIKQNIPDSGLKMQLPMVGEVVFYKQDADVLRRYIGG